MFKLTISSLLILFCSLQVSAGPHVLHGTMSSGGDVKAFELIVDDNHYTGQTEAKLKRLGEILEANAQAKRNIGDRKPGESKTKYSERLKDEMIRILNANNLNEAKSLLAKLTPSPSSVLAIGTFLGSYLAELAPFQNAGKAVAKSEAGSAVLGAFDYTKSKLESGIEDVLVAIGQKPVVDGLARDLEGANIITWAHQIDSKNGRLLTSAGEHLGKKAFELVQAWKRTEQPVAYTPHSTK